MTANQNFTFNHGQIVKLKSGGPNMVINGRGTMPAQNGEDSTEVYTCAWIDSEGRPYGCVYCVDAIVSVQ